MSALVVAIDAMSGDFGPHCIVPACVSSLAEIPSLHLVLVGQAPLLEELIARHPSVDRARLRIEHASDVIAMGERPAQTLRNKPDASMRVALELLQEGRVQACVSAGNTGALMALSRHILKTLPGIDRPAMVATIPTSRGICQLLDVGANVDCTAEQLYQFAVMGSVAAQALGMSRPRVALLNVGTEDIKGNQRVRMAASLLQRATALNYIGFIEGDGVYRGLADVVVCDGFVGNVLVKSSEGLVAMINGEIKAQFGRNIGARLVGTLALPFFRRLKTELRSGAYNGASFLGLQGIVVKCHGASGPKEFQGAIRRALAEIQQNMPQRLHGRLEGFLTNH